MPFPTRKHPWFFYPFSIDRLRFLLEAIPWNKGKRARRSRCRSLGLELLEDRTAPATLGPLLVAIDAGVTPSNASSFSSQIDNALSGIDLPTTQSTLSAIVSSGVTSAFGAAFSEFRNGFTMGNGSPTTQLTDIEQQGLTLVGSSNDPNQLEFQYTTTLANPIPVVAASDLGLSGSSYLQKFSSAAFANPNVRISVPLTITFGSVVTSSGPTFFLGGGDLINSATITGTAA